MIARVLLDIEAAVGLGVCAAFLLLHRPTRRWSAASLYVTGWPIVVAIVFARQVLVYSVRGSWTRPATGDLLDTLTSVIGYAIAVVMATALLIIFLRIRHTARRTRMTDDSTSAAAAAEPLPNAPGAGQTADDLADVHTDPTPGDPPCEVDPGAVVPADTSEDPA